jgi:hypothetical protein
MLRFYNMKKSTRGAIRRSPNAVSWVYALSGMVGDAASVLKAWNDQAPKCDKIIGQKSQAVKNLLDADLDVRDAVLGCVSEFSWDSGLS